MTGLTGYGWSTPESWTIAAGPRLVSQWDQILGTKEDGTHSRCFASSCLGRIAIANSDAGARALVDGAIDQAHRAVQELVQSS
jgi:hypothetical protein